MRSIGRCNAILKEGVHCYETKKTNLLFPEQKALIWDRYKQGDSLHVIARMFDRYHSSIMPKIYATGGFSPPERKRHPASLSLREREEISRGLAANLSLREIARNLFRAASTICCEVKRHGDIKHCRANKADAQAWDNTKRLKECMLKGNSELCYVIVQKLKRAWSPQQILGWLKRRYVNNQEVQVSHETIYKTLYIQTRGALKKELQKCLRTKCVIRKSRATSLKGKGIGRINDAVSISERPAEVEDRAIPSYWKKI